MSTESTANSQAALDQPRAVRAGEELDLAALEAFLRAHIPGIAGPLRVQQFPSGYSNLTYLVRAGDLQMVLRRPPFGNVVKSAHDMGREYRVLSALHPVYELAPRPLAYCEEDSVLGAPFYVMQRLEGVVLRRQPPAGFDASAGTMRRLCEAFVENLVRLHGLDYAAAGLSELGRPEGYVRRQEEGWSKRYEKAATEEIAAASRVMRWLAENQPPAERQAAALIHNDYKFDNLVLDPSDPARIVGVLDWEMCTIGDPLMDLGSTLGYWVQADDSPMRRAFVTGPTDLPGCMTRQELFDRYVQASGRPAVDPLFYYVYGLFKLAVIVQQIYRRYVQGHTKDPRFAELGKVVHGLCAAGAEAMETGRI